MSALIEQIATQERIADQLEINRENRTALLEKVRDFTNKFIDQLPDKRSFTAAQPDKAPLKINKHRPKSIEEALAVFQKQVNDKGLLAASGGHVGYIPGGGIYAGALGDFLAAVSNAYAGVSYASPGAAAIENEVINWLKEIFGFPKSAVGNLASGGSISNMIALTAARDKHGVKNEKIPQSVIYLSKQAHHCIQKALRIIGLGDVVVRYIDLDNDFKIKPEALQQQIQADKAAGLQPFLVVASAGTTDVGAIDPLEEIASITHQNGLWLHIDAAYGGFFVLSSRKDKFKGIEKADSLVVDPHKGLFLPYGLGAVLIKDAKAVLQSHTSSGNYLQDAVIDDLTQDPANVSPELTKHFRGMRLWLPLQLHGIQPFVACLEEKLLLTKYFRQELLKRGFKVGPEPDLSVSYFWYPQKENQNEFNHKLMRHIHADGRVFFSSTLIHSDFVIRMAILSFRTKKATIDKALEMIEDCLAKTKKT